MDNQEQLPTQGTMVQDEEQRNTICVGRHLRKQT